MKLMQKKILVPICILLIFIVIGTVWYLLFENKYENYQPTDAVITNHWVTHDGHTKAGGGRLYHWEYTYSVDGKEYSGYDRYSGDSGESDIGATVTVWYNPDSPDESTMSTNASMNFIAPLFLALPLMLGTYTFFSRQEKKRKQL